jgi:hypothetical protein
MRFREVYTYFQAIVFIMQSYLIFIWISQTLLLFFALVTGFNEIKTFPFTGLLSSSSKDFG